MTKPLIGTLGCLALLAFVFSVGLPTAAEAASKVPPGFIAVSKDWLTFDDAKAFCEQHGGKLPRINNRDSVDAGDKLKADGFGALGDPWPAGLSNDAHWTDTTDSAGKRWLAMESSGKVFLRATYLDARVPYPYRVACVATGASGTPAPQPADAAKPQPTDPSKPQPGGAETPQSGDPAKPPRAGTTNPTPGGAAPHRPDDPAKPLPVDAATKKSALPPGFIAISESPMSWTDAKAFCQQKGGKLPRVNNSDSWAKAGREKITRIDGFGAPGTHFPSGLPDGAYWTGTKRADLPGDAWYVHGPGGLVGYDAAEQASEYHAACVH